MSIKTSTSDGLKTYSDEQLLIERPSSKPDKTWPGRPVGADPIDDVAPRATRLEALRQPIVAHPARRAVDKPVAMPQKTYGTERVLLTLVFTDIVGSTERLERVGDRVWCALLSNHHDLVRRHLLQSRGREVDAAGDGFFLAFDLPSQAVSFALVVRSALQEIGIEIRIGIHVGECEVSGGRVEGLAVHTAARVAGAATAGEVLVSGTVKDLVAGSGHRFEERETRILKGLSGPRALFALHSTRAGT